MGLRLLVTPRSPASPGPGTSPSTRGITGQSKTGSITSATSHSGKTPRKHAPETSRTRTPASATSSWEHSAGKDAPTSPPPAATTAATTSASSPCASSSRDTFHNKTLFGYRDDKVKHELQSILGEVSDDGIIALRQRMSVRFGFDLEDKATRDAVKSLALENCFNPVCDLIDKAEAEKLVEQAHQVCPYSRATRNNVEVKLIVV